MRSREKQVPASVISGERIRVQVLNATTSRGLARRATFFLRDKGFDVVEIGTAFLAVPRVVAFGAAIAVALCLWLIMQWTDTGKAIRAVAKEKLGAELIGIEVAHIYAVTFGLGTACLAIAACLLIPSYYVNPGAGNAFVLIAFTIVVLGGMGSVVGALLGGLFVGVVESLSGLYLGESLGQIGIFVMFILVFLFRPNGLFGERV